MTEHYVLFVDSPHITPSYTQSQVLCGLVKTAGRGVLPFLDTRGIKPQRNDSDET
jgi:hypothetical protein